MRKKPKVNVNCVADRWSMENEKIVEFSGNTFKQGGLISFTISPEGKMKICLYRLDNDVEVTVEKQGVSSTSLSDTKVN